MAYLKTAALYPVVGSAINNINNGVNRSQRYRDEKYRRRSSGGDINGIWQNMKSIG